MYGGAGRLPGQIEDPPVEEAEEALFSLGRAAVAFVVVLAVGRLVLVPLVTRIVATRNPQNATLHAATTRYLSGIVVLVALVVGVAAGGYGHYLGGSAVIVAALTLALGVAGREVIGDLVSGLFLVADPDFNVDDWISWTGGEGVVESISYRVTRVRTPNNEVVIVPNTTLATGEVTRPYGREEFRITVDLDVAYEADFDAAAAALADEAVAVDGVLSSPEPDVWILDLGDDAVRLRVALWVTDPQRGDVVRVRSDFYERAIARLEALDVPVSPPSQHELSGGIDVHGDRSADTGDSGVDAGRDPDRRR